MAAISSRDLFVTFARIGLASFGGPAGQIAVMHRVLVEEKRWIGEHRFLHALNYCMLLPGPEAQQLCTYCGWLLRGTWGGLVAGLLFVLPGFVAILACSLLYVYAGDLAAVQAAFVGLKPAVLGIVAAALVRIGRRALRHPLAWGLAVTVAVALFAGVPFPLLIAIAALVGFVAERTRPGILDAPAHAAAQPIPEPVIPDAALTHVEPTARRALRVTVLGGLLWLGPVALLHVLGGQHVFAEVARFFSVVAVVTFGGAYAVLPYVADHAVADMHWLSAPQMMDGLGLAETTPGPLIMVVQWVGFLAAWHRPEGMLPIVAATGASVITTWVTFAPSFLWIFVGAPYVERLRTHAAVRAALAAITAAVVGGIAKLALWFAVHASFTTVTDRDVLGLRLPVPDVATIDVTVALATVVATLGLVRFRWSLGVVLLGCVVVVGGLRLLGA